MADIIGTGFPQFSCALVQMRYSIGENGCGHILKRGRGARVERQGKGGRGDTGEWRFVKGNSRTGGNTNKNNTLSKKFNASYSMI